MTFQEPSHITQLERRCKLPAQSSRLTQVQFQLANVLNRIQHLRIIFKRALQEPAVLSFCAGYPLTTLMTFMISRLILQTE